MSSTFNILIVIDTDLVRASYKSPSKNSSSPTGISHKMGYMIGTGGPSVVVSGQGTGDLVIKALVGDTVRFFATSGSDNFEDAVLLYGITPFSGDTVFGTFHYQDFTKSTVVPGSEDAPLPPQIVDEQFWFYQASVKQKGTEGYNVVFALYTRDSNGQPSLYGYFYWDPTIEVDG